LITVVLEFNGEITNKQFEKKLKENLVDLKNKDGSYKHPKTRSRATKFLSYICMIPNEDFNIDNHLENVKELCKSNEQFEEIVEEISNRSIHEKGGLPPWKLHLVKCQVNNSETTSRLIVRFDHIVMDGGAFFLVFLPALLDCDEDSSKMFSNLKRMTKMRKLSLNLKGLVLFPFFTLRVLFSLIKDVNPIYTQDKKKTCGRYMCPSVTVRLSVLKDISNKSNIKINPILTTCIVRAIDKLATERTGLRDPNWSYTIMYPTSLWIPGDKLELANRMAVLSSRFTSEEIVQSNALELAKNKLEGPAVVPFSWASYVYGALSGNSLPRFLADATGNVIRRYTAIFSNINGPATPKYCCGKMLSSMYAYVSVFEDVGKFNLSF
jgi:hypothetical protein